MAYMKRLDEKARQLQVPFSGIDTAYKVGYIDCLVMLRVLTIAEADVLKEFVMSTDK